MHAPSATVYTTTALHTATRQLYARSHPASTDTMMGCLVLLTLSLLLLAINQPGWPPSQPTRSSRKPLLAYFSFIVTPSTAVFCERCRTGRGPCTTAETNGSPSPTTVVLVPPRQRTRPAKGAGGVVQRPGLHNTRANRLVLTRALCRVIDLARVGPLRRERLRRLVLGSGLRSRGECRAWLPSRGSCATRSSARRAPTSAVCRCARGRAICGRRAGTDARAHRHRRACPTRAMCAIGYAPLH